MPKVKEKFDRSNPLILHAFILFISAMNAAIIIWKVEFSVEIDLIIFFLTVFLYLVAHVLTLLHRDGIQQTKTKYLTDATVTALLMLASLVFIVFTWRFWQPVLTN